MLTPRERYRVGSGRGSYLRAPDGYLNHRQIADRVRAAGPWRKQLTTVQILHGYLMPPRMQWRDMQDAAEAQGIPFEDANRCCLPDAEAAKYIAALIANQQARHDRWEALERTDTPTPAPKTAADPTATLSARDRRIIKAWRTYRGPMHWRYRDLPKMKGVGCFREHAGVSDCKLADMRRLKDLI